ncbi:MAG TPA: cyclic-di-AMP receptor [Candidatus Limnocylindrales bacterium]
MKLLIAFVHQFDVDKVSEGLLAGGHRFTRLPSVGGFLGEASATFVMAVEDDRLDEVLSAFERSSEARDVEIPLNLHGRLEDWKAATVRFAGATILIGELERVVKT